MTFFTMEELIEAFFQSPNYQIGVEIYNRFGKSEFNKKLFEKGFSNYSYDKLKKELQALLEAQKPALSVLEAGSKQVVTNVNSQETTKEDKYKDAPDELKALIQKRKSLYAEARFLKDHLTEHDDEKRRVDCLRILSCFAEINQLWEITNYWDEHKEMPPKTDISSYCFEEFSDVELNQKYLNAYKYIQKNISKDYKKQLLQERYEEAIAIKTYLESNMSFQYSNLNLPKIDGKE